MRTIKFRGKRLDDGRWVYGYLTLISDGEGYIRDIASKKYSVERVDINTLGQFTGLKDSQGKEIYEGDYLKYDFDTHTSYEIAAFRNGRFISVDPAHPYRDDALHLCLDKAVVIGDIYNNQGLVKAMTLIEVDKRQTATDTNETASKL